jgi:dipeptide/tripeptide permease
LQHLHGPLPPHRIFGKSFKYLHVPEIRYLPRFTPFFILNVTPFFATLNIPVVMQKKSTVLLVLIALGYILASCNRSITIFDAAHGGKGRKCRNVR